MYHVKKYEIINNIRHPQRQPPCQKGNRKQETGNNNNKQITLSHALNKGPVVLSFYRGAWCPFCNLHLHALQKSLPVFKNYNAQLITITPQKHDKSVIHLNKDKFEFEVLSDLDSTAMKAYNMLYKLDDKLVKVYKKYGLDI